MLRDYYWWGLGDLMLGIEHESATCKSSALGAVTIFPAFFFFYVSVFWGHTGWSQGSITPSRIIGMTPVLSRIILVAPVPHNRLKYLTFRSSQGNKKQQGQFLPKNYKKCRFPPPKKYTRSCLTLQSFASPCDVTAVSCSRKLSQTIVKFASREM